MTRKPKPERKHTPAASVPSAAVPRDEEALDASDPGERISSRPDGYYWQALDGRQEIGPFETFAEAMADMDSGDAAQAAALASEAAQVSEEATVRALGRTAL